MATNAMIGYQTTVFYADAESPGIFTQVTEVIEVTPPNAVADDVDATHFTSPNRTREYIAGFIEPGEASFGVNRIPGGSLEIALMALRDSGARRMWRFVWPNNTIWDFVAYVKGHETTSPIDDRMTATYTLKVAGSTTVTVGSPTPP
jgi:Lambda phage tail tube protein, TTP